MALPTWNGNGPALSIGDINVELGRTRTTANSTLRNLANLAKSGSTPYINRAGENKISHWYGYTHSITPGNVPANTNARSLLAQGSTFALARGGGSASAETNAHLNCNYNTTGPVYYFGRFFVGFNFTGLTGITAAYMTFYSASVSTSYNNLKQNTDFVLVRTTTSKPYNYLWLASDFPLGTGATIVSNVVTMTPSDTAKDYQFTLNAAGISYLNTGGANCSFALIEYGHDHLNSSTGLPTATSNQLGGMKCLLGNIVMFYS